MKTVLLTTHYKGVFVGFVSNETDFTQKTIYNIQKCRNVIYWSGTNGFMGICKNGINAECRLSEEANVIALFDVTGIFEITEKAAETIWR